ncbi:MAG: phosphatase PAP2 family protein [Pseudomonadota bacterium]
MTALGGSHSSPLMTVALAWANEGINDPGALRVERRLGAVRGVERLEWLNPVMGQILLVNRLKEGLTVTPGTRTNATAIVSLASKPIYTLERPNDNDDLLAQSKHIFAAFDLRADRSAEIYLQQWDMLSFLGSSLQLNAISQGWTLALLEAVMSAAMNIVAEVKYRMDLPRPVDLYPQLAPIIQTPQHSALPSGHASEGFAAAYVLSRLKGLTDAETVSHENLIFRMASRIAINRTVAGVHYPMDSMAGACLGITLGRVFWSRICHEDGGQDIQEPASGFDIAAHAFGGQNFTLSELLRFVSPKPDSSDPAWLVARPPVPFSEPIDGKPELAWVRDKAVAELTRTITATSIDPAAVV